MQLALEEAEKEKSHTEERFRKDVRNAATSNSSALELLQQEFEAKEQILKAEASQALQSAQRDYKARMSVFHRNLSTDWSYEQY